MSAPTPLHATGTAVCTVRARTIECGALLRVHVIARDDDVVTLHLDGELDVSNADDLADVLGDRLRSGRRFLRLDVSALTFCDSAGLTVLIRAHNHALRQRGTLVLTGVRRPFARLLAVLHLDEALFVSDGPGRLPHVRRACVSAAAG